MGWVVLDNLFRHRKKIYLYLQKMLMKHEMTNDSLRKRSFLSNCRQVTCIIVSNVQQHKWRCTTPCRWLEDTQTEVWPDIDLFFSFGICSQQASILTVPCLVVAACCLFQSMSSTTLMPASISPSTSANFKTVTVLSLRLGPGSSASWRAPCFRPVGAELFHADGQTDITKLVVAFRNFANAPENVSSHYVTTFTTWRHSLRDDIHPRLKCQCSPKLKL
jgi:hypothetical protein